MLIKQEDVNLLELVSSSLPLATQLDSHLDATKHVLMATLIVHSELENIAVLPCENTTLPSNQWNSRLSE